MKNKKKENKKKKAESSAKHRAENAGKSITALGGSIGRSVRDGNYIILIMVIAISVFGLIMVFSAGYYSTVNMTDPDPLYYLRRQGAFVVTGLIIMLIVSTIDYHIYTKFSRLIILLSLLLLVLVLIIGTEANGATRWISVLGIAITPSEISKLAVIIFTSCFLAEDPSRIKSAKGLLTIVVVLGLHVLLILKQPNLSTAIVICLIMGGIMLVAGLQTRWIAASAGVFGIGFLLLITVFKDSYWYDRIMSFADPFADAQGSGYQVSQSIIALGNGGLTGLGLGNSIAKNLYLPEPQNDFILAVIGEELGFIGVMLLMMFYLVFVFVLIMTAMCAKDKLGMYLASGVAVMLGLQVIINVAVCTASMPATGITLPFVSYGGTSLWIFMAAMGIALNVSRGMKPAVVFKLKRNE